MGASSESAKKGVEVNTARQRGFTSSLIERAQGGERSGSAFKASPTKLRARTTYKSKGGMGRCWNCKRKLNDGIEKRNHTNYQGLKKGHHMKLGGPRPGNWLAPRPPKWGPRFISLAPAPVGAIAAPAWFHAPPAFTVTAAHCTTAALSELLSNV